MMIHTFLARKNNSKIWTLLEKEKQVKDIDSLRKGRTSQIYGLSSKMRKKSNIWTLLRKEEQVEDMNPPRMMREQVDNTDPPWKWGVMMRLSLMTVILS